MTRDDYQSLRTQYADIDDLCSRVERADTGEAYEVEVRRLVRLLTVQQRAPDQIRSFVTHLGAPDDVIDRLLGQSSTRASGDNVADQAGVTQ